MRGLPGSLVLMLAALCMQVIEAKLPQRVSRLRRVEKRIDPVTPACGYPAPRVDLLPW